MDNSVKRIALQYQITGLSGRPIDSKLLLQDQCRVISHRALTLNMIALELIHADRMFMMELNKNFSRVMKSLVSRGINSEWEIM